MVKIEKIDKSRLRNDEHFQFNTEFRDIVVKEGAQNYHFPLTKRGYL
ncbi:MAG: hypothetical protein LBQ87_07330 [Candidatus Fibromonas sp.]|jgi:hypothetical protein|nr:hypothetical protein [Candidatus Fibromonas sp.]